MLPYIIIHNSISLDGSLTNFDVNMELHYQIANKYRPDAHLIGSNTIRKGIEVYGSISKEEEKDFNKPDRDNNLPFWAIIDTKGILHNMLHEVRRFEFCKDVILLISKETPEEYITYLHKRNYTYHILGTKQIDLDKSLEFLFKNYNIETLLTDCGRILSNILLNKGLVKEISLLIHPIIVGNKSYNIFDNIPKKIQLLQLKSEILNKNYVGLVYKIVNNI
jgi:2,5-diamino-6-(ribosylamino)-4(3H)-pyrimidinone 5'-phosphate reductase